MVNVQNEFLIIRTDLAPYGSNKPTVGTNATTIHSCCSLCTLYQSRQCPRLCETRVPTLDQNLYSKQCRAKLHVGLCIRVYAAAPRRAARAPVRYRRIDCAVACCALQFTWAKELCQQPLCICLPRRRVKTRDNV